MDTSEMGLVSTEWRSGYSIVREQLLSMSWHIFLLSMCWHSTSNNKNGWVGVGWALEVGAIQRQIKPRGGLDYAADEYAFKSANGVVDLVNKPGTQEYYAKIESDFTRFEKVDNVGVISWVATAKDGEKFYFGRSGAQQTSADGSKVFKWCLDSIEDSHGNQIQYHYTYAQGQVYLDSITYSETLVRFYLESRDDTHKKYTTKFPVETAKRLKTIEIRSSGYPVRTYKFTYDADTLSAGDQYSSTGRSLLSGVELYGSDVQLSGNGDILGGSAEAVKMFGWQNGNGGFSQSPNYLLLGEIYNNADGGKKHGDFVDVNGDGLPDWINSYHDYQSGVYSSSNWTHLNTGSGWELSSAYSLPTYIFDYVNGGKRQGDFVDVNGDGLPDWVVAYLDTQSHRATYLNTGSGWEANPEYQLPTEIYYSADGGKKNGDFVDVNGDGLSDWVVAYLDTQSHRTTYLNNGSGWEASPAYQLPTEIYNNAVGGLREGAFVDVNGDGLPDWVVAYQDANLVSHFTTYLNTGSGWEASPEYQLPTCIYNHNQTIVGLRYGKFVDVNGDGLIDWVTAFYIGTSSRTTYLNTGLGWEASPEYQLPTDIYNDIDGGKEQGDFVDVNGDGLPDWVVAYRDTESHRTTYLNTGSGWQANPEYQLSTDIYDGGKRQGDFVDVNGDGLPDWVWAYKGDQSYRTTYLNIAHSAPTSPEKGRVPDLLASIKNNFGGTVAIEYQAFSSSLLPSPIQVVSSVILDDGNETVSTSEYEYSGVYFQKGERDFRGFNIAKMTGEKLVTETWFHQGADTQVDVNNPNVKAAFMKGTPYKVRVSDKADPSVVYSETRTEYHDDLDAGLSYFNPPKKVETEAFDGSASLTSRVEYPLYDIYGNVLLEEHYGDVATGDDDYTIERAFYDNPDNFLVGFLKYERVYEGVGVGGTKKAETTYYYDETLDFNQPMASFTHAFHSPTKGDLTSVVRWNNDRDQGWNDQAEDVQSWAQYDFFGNPRFLRAANGEVSEIRYDSSYTYPVMKINPKGQAETTTYYGVDGVAADNGLPGQVKSVTSPTGSFATTTYDVFGRKLNESLSDGSQTSWLYLNFGQPGSQYIWKMDSGGYVLTFFDGFQRTTKTRSSGPDGKVIVTEQVYGPQGQVVASSLPAFDGDPQNWVQTSYDALGRPVRIEKPDLTFVEFCYGLNVSTQVDENRHHKRMTNDLRGNMVRVDEYNDTSAVCTTDVGTPYATTTYGYDVLGQLTSVTDAKGNQTQMTYDSLGRKVAMNDPDMGHWEYRYDGNGNLTWQKDAKQQEINLAYDSLGRLVTKTYPDSSTVTLTYDDSTHGCPGDTATQGCAAGHVTSMVDASGRTDYYYDDPRGRVSRKVQTVDGQSYTVETGLDSLGRISYVTYPDGETVGYDYDAAGNLVHAGTYATFESYNALGQPGKTTYGNGVTTDYAYDPLSQRLWTIDTAHAGASLLQLSYGYDDKGNVRDITDGNDPTKSQAFVYDSLDRLRSATSTAYGQLAYSYDEIGNLLAKGGGPEFYFEDINGNGIWDNGIDPLQNSETGDYAIPYTQFGMATDTPIVGDWNGDGKKDVGVFRPSGTSAGWYLDANGNNHWDSGDIASDGFGGPTDIPVVGDWNGDGVDNIGVWRNGTWYLDMNGNYQWDAGDLTFAYGDPAGVPLVGDWNGDGIDTPGVKVGSTYYLRNSNSAGAPDVTPFSFGLDTDIPIVGDWDNNGADTIGVKRGSVFYLHNSNASGAADVSFSFGMASDLPVVGAWLVDGPDKVGVFRQGNWYFDRSGNGLWDPPTSPDAVDYSIESYGLAGDAPLVGDWNGDGVNSVGVFRNGEWRLDVDKNGIGSTSDAYYPAYGLAGDLPVSGDWDGDGVTEVGVFRNGEWRLDVDNNGVGSANDIYYPAYGLAGDVPVAGDWDGDGVTEVGVFRNGEWRLDADNNGVGSAGDMYYPAFGTSTMKPVTGDWNGDGKTEIGAYDNGTWYLDYNGNGVWDGPFGGDVQAQFGTSTMSPITGDWNLDGKTDIGAYENGTWYFDFNGNGVWDPLTQPSNNPIAYTPHPTKPHALAASSDGRTYSYDDNGNMIYDGTRYLTWDYDNRPVFITMSGGAETSFVYDGNGARVKKVGPAGTVIYIGKYYEISGGAPVKYIFANGQRIALETGQAVPNDVLYYHQDHLGSSGVVTRSDGTVAEEISYKPFGETLQDEGSVSINHRFTGQERDDETDLYYYNARYYNSIIGRFISADTIVPDPTNPQAFNRYSYVINNPLIYTDPSGHRWGWWEDLEDWTHDFEQDAEDWIHSQEDDIGEWCDGVFGSCGFSGGGGVESSGGDISFVGMDPSTGETFGGSHGGGPSSGSGSESGPGSGGALVFTIYQSPYSPMVSSYGFISAPPSASNRILDSLYTRWDKFKHPSAWGEGQATENGMFIINTISIPLTGLGPKAEAAAIETVESFFEGSYYSMKTLRKWANAADAFHNFPESVAAFGRVIRLRGGDGIMREALEVEGGLQTPSGWKDGIFQWIKESNGKINHRTFEPHP